MLLQVFLRTSGTVLESENQTFGVLLAFKKFGMRRCSVVSQTLSLSLSLYLNTKSCQIKSFVISTKQTFARSKSATETIEKSAKYVQS